MKIQLRDLNKMKLSLRKLVNADNIPSRVCYRATKFTKKVSADLDALEDTRIKLVKQYGEKIETGEIKVPSNKEDEFTAAFIQCLDEEVEIPDIKISLSDLEKANLSMLDFANLDFLISEEDVPSKP